MRLKELREKTGFTQAKLAEIIDIGTKVISNYETGRTFPASRLIEIANALRVDIQTLFEYDHLALSKEELKAKIIDYMNILPEDKLIDLYKITKSLYG